MKSIIFKTLFLFALILCLQSATLKHKTKSKDTFTVESLFNSNAAPAAAAPAAAAAGAAASPAKIIKEGWLKLSSVQTLSTRRYPNIPLGNNNFAKVDNIRKNVATTPQAPGQASPGESFRKNQHSGIDKTVPSEESFYFRISGLNLYYTETQKDMIVLGAIAVTNIVSPSTSALGLNCFRVVNLEGDKWDLCAKDAKEKETWVCGISQAMGRPCEKAGTTQAGPVIINEKRIVKEPMILIPLPSPVCNEDWNYGSHGTNWNCKCTEGFEQSPINIEKRCVSNINETASFQWSKVKAEKLSVFYEDNMLKVKCKFDDPTQCVDVVFGRIIDSDFTEYESREIRVHTPAEHTIEGRQFQMEIQLIYQPTSDGDYKKKAAIAFLCQQGPGKNNKFIESLDLMSLPNIYQPKLDVKTLTNDALELDVEELLKDVDDVYEYNGFFNFWKYTGSLTSPPCDEHVRWFIVEKPVHVGYAALNMIKDVLAIPTLGARQADGGSKFVADLNSPKNPDGNNRDPSPIRDRSILYYDSRASNCAPQPVKKPVHGPGHYEKIPRKSDTFVWIKGDKPSGIEGSFVVPEWEAKGLESPEDQRNNDINNVANGKE